MMQAFISAKRIKASSMWVTLDGDEKAPLDSYITLIEEYGKLKRAIELNVGDEVADVIDSSVSDVDKGQEIHMELVEEGFDSGYLMGSALASGYGCGRPDGGKKQEDRWGASPRYCCDNGAPPEPPRPNGDDQSTLDSKAD
ncbi:hypothetical protein L7F22_020576 [Adiantum nelumboides]|nr:hypothetical protein [Adiantum nelumboides]